MDIYTAIDTRRTIRDFQDKQIERNVIEKIISAGMKAPTNDHMRNWEFIVVDDKSVRARILRVIPDRIPTAENDVNNWLDSWSNDENQRNMYLKAMPRQYSMLYNAGSLILPFFHHEGSLLQPEELGCLNGLASIWCCIENILLAATAEGIFGVTRIPVDNEATHIKSVVNHPDGYIMPCYIGLGYPSEKAVKIVQREISVEKRLHFDKL